MLDNSAHMLTASLVDAGAHPTTTLLQLVDSLHPMTSHSHSTSTSSRRPAGSHCRQVVHDSGCRCSGSCQITAPVSVRAHRTHQSDCIGVLRHPWQRICDRYWLWQSLPLSSAAATNGLPQATDQPQPVWHADRRVLAAVPSAQTGDLPWYRRLRALAST